MRRVTVFVAQHVKIDYNYSMDHLKELIKQSIEFHKSQFDCSKDTDEDVFEMVMENVVSMVEEYRFEDLNKQ